MHNYVWSFTFFWIYVKSLIIYSDNSIKIEFLNKE